MRVELAKGAKRMRTIENGGSSNDVSEFIKQKKENNACDCEKVSYVHLWAILFLVVLFIAMVEW